jgi:hypothetical protein
LRELARSDWRNWTQQLLKAGGDITSDQLITCLMHCDNGTLGGYPGFSETWHAVRLGARGPCHAVPAARPLTWIARADVLFACW